MTLPIDRDFPFRPEEITSGGEDLGKYMRDLVNDVQNMYGDMVDNIDGREAEYTPVIEGGTVAGTGTYNVQKGLYLRSGIRTFVWFYVDWSAHTGNGDLRVTLPYLVKNVNIGPFFMGSIETANIAWPGGVTSIATRAVQNSRYAQIIGSGSGAPSAWVQLPGAGYIVGWVYYIGVENG